WFHHFYPKWFSCHIFHVALPPIIKNSIKIKIHFKYILSYNKKLSICKKNIIMQKNYTSVLTFAKSFDIFYLLGKLSRKKLNYGGLRCLSIP
ncbi:MAG: hypothetical protein CSB16_03335, partial [Clostridiales bacterium]